MALIVIEIDATGDGAKKVAKKPVNNNSLHSKIWARGSVKKSSIDNAFIATIKINHILLLRFNPGADKGGCNRAASERAKRERGKLAKEMEFLSGVNRGGGGEGIRLAVD